MPEKFNFKKSAEDEENILEITEKEEKKNSHENRVGKKYNFPEIMTDLKPGIISLAYQLKNAIEKGEYQTLIGDDAKGRIPTLILRKIFIQKAPNPKELQTIFLALGRGKEWDSSLENFISANKDRFGKVLFITEMVSSEANTLAKIFGNFDKGNKFINYDVATVYSSKSKEEEIKKEVSGKGYWTKVDEYPHRIFIGVGGNKIPTSIRNDKTPLGSLSGVQRRKAFSPITDSDYNRPWYIIGAHSKKIQNLEENPEPFPEEIGRRVKELGISRENYNSEEEEKEVISNLRSKIDKKEVSPERIKEIEETIKKAREDVDLMADEIMEEIWGLTL